MKFYSIATINRNNLYNIASSRLYLLSYIVPSIIFLITIAMIIFISIYINIINKDLRQDWIKARKIKKANKKVPKEININSKKYKVFIVIVFLLSLICFLSLFSISGLLIYQLLSGNS
ncbi:hypothetical protein [Mycoplasmopsis meleagridis]|nr:hypothetical protein [Mycoplasmopsis meleagridis]VEU77273.1 Uncharacterised protein [Mycoplasmopsis meleagridis]